MYEVNDWVKIKENFWNIQPTVNLGISPEMKMLAGEEYKIRKVGHNGIKTRYRLESGSFYPYDWIWDENWLQPVTEIKDVLTEEFDSIFQNS